MARASITFRLTLLFVAASTAVLIAVGTLIGASVETHFEEQDRMEMGGKLELVRHALAKVGAPDGFEAMRQYLDDALIGNHGLSIAIFASGHRILYATHHADFPPQMTVAHAGTKQSGPLDLVVWKRGEHSYRGIAATAMDGMGNGAYTVAIALDIAHHRSFMLAFKKTLWVSVGLGILLTGLLGWFAARRGLAPLREMAQVAKGISASHLDDRLPLAAVPAELIDLAVSFNDMLSRLEDSFRRLSEFSSDLAHELRTPVSNLMTQTQVALSHSRTAEEYREILYSNLEEYDRLARMVTDMLFLAKADNGLIVPNREAIDLAAEVDGLIEFYEALTEEKGITITRRGGGCISGDRLMIRRALSNLISNAIRHTPRGGSVGIGMADAGEEAIRISVENPGDDIAPGHLPRLFDRFYRADPSRHRGSEGAGLGLAITKSIIEAHGGSISVFSAAGKTRFEVRISKCS